MQRLALLITGLLTATACVTTASKVDYGVQSGHTGYVPARMAIVGCSSWPDAARFESLTLTNIKGPGLQELCKATDQYVLAGFSNQPFMKGFSPKFVADSLVKANATGLLTSLPKVWAHRASDCYDCRNPAAFYSASLAERPEWLQWLNTLSTSVANADAVVMPFVTYAHERRFADRGMQIAERSAGLTMLLIDTNNGALLWAGGREVVASNKSLETSAAALDWPPWSDVNDRLFVEDLWRDFPGRQSF